MVRRRAVQREKHEVFFSQASGGAKIMSDIRPQELV